MEKLHVGWRRLAALKRLHQGYRRCAGSSDENAVAWPDQLDRGLGCHQPIRDQLKR
jgi:hypothetical protein